MEIDLEILDMIRLNANAKEEKWSAKVGYEWDGGSFVESSGQSNAYVKGTWFQTLGNKIQSVSNDSSEDPTWWCKLHRSKS